MIKRILIVDDSTVARKILKSCFPKESSYEIFEAANGLDRIKKYKDYKPDILFLDLTMPGLTGFEVIPIIKQEDADAVIVVISADIQPESIIRVMKLGAFTIVRKPVKPAILIETIRKCERHIEQLRVKK